MTIFQWAACSDPTPMLEFLRGRASDRKLWLFAVACCRRIGHLVKERRCWEALEAAEQCADGVIGLEELKAAHSAAHRGKPLFADASWAAAWAAAPLASQAAEESSLQAAQTVARIASENPQQLAWAAVRTGACDDEQIAAWARFEAAMEEASAVEREAQAGLLRELIGNPFLPVNGTASFPHTVVELAESLYAGADCAFALHDALLEAGEEALAGHFADPAQWHPKGCWAVDRILGKS
jgi:hypothetical protein